MGIPHLANQLQPYGTKVLLSRAPTGPDGQTPAVIDGPSLAYQCLYICLSRHSSAQNSYEALPSYKELGEAAVSWLEQIEQYGMKVEAVFFDGLLPLSKKPTRLSRLQNYANQLVAFRALNKNDLPRSVSNVQSSESNVLGTVTLSARLKSLPAPPFLVPAVIEAILSSRFGKVTSTIPGEADAYCAQSARKLGGTIFTSDSDLLVHDLGEAGKVILFRDIETIHLPSKGTCLKTLQYHPYAIAAKFDLSSLVRPAFFMVEDYHRGFKEATKLAKNKNPTSEEFTAFKEQYASLPVFSSLAEEYLTHSERPAFKLLSRLDPRISELVHQISMKMVDPADSDKVLDMYLPFLLDDSTRTSAWRAGADIRKLGYSLLRLLDSRISQINEYERKGTRISDTVSILLHPDEISAAARAVCETLSVIRPSEQNSNLSTASRWRALAAALVCQSNLENGKTPPSTPDLTRLVTGCGNGSLSWSFIHASAQSQAVLYSLRLLFQTSQLVLALLEETQEQQENRKSLLELVESLRELPRLSDIFDDYSKVEDETELQIKNLISGSLRSLGVADQQQEEQEQDLDNGMNAGKRKKKRKKKEEHAVETPPPVWRQNNMFGSLSQ